MDVDKKAEILKDSIMACIVLLIAVIGGMLSLGIGMDFNTYYSLSGGDGVLVSELVKSIQENGIKGMYVCYRVGAPGVESLVDFPATDILMGMILWLISLLVSSTPKVLYVYYLSTFAMTSMALVLLLRKLKIRRDITAVISLAFSFAPYHFLRGIGHCTLINYISLAMTIYLCLCIIGYFEKERKWIIGLVAVLLGLGYGYYYAFGLILMALAIIFYACRTGNIKNATKKLWIPAVTLGSVAVALSPQILFNIINGKNELAGMRFPIEQEIYGLKIFQMFLSPEYSLLYDLFPRLEEIRDSYVTTAPLITENSTSSLGIVTLFGFFGLCIAFIYSFAAKERSNSKDWLLIDYLSLSTIALLLTASIGGFGEIFNFLVTPQIRCYNRCSIYISGIALVFLAFSLNQLKFKHRLTSPIICLFLLVIVMSDTVLIKSSDWQEPIKSTQICYESFFKKVEDSLDEGAMVYQLPYLDFPEIAGTYDYKHFVGYLFTDSLRWSYGGVKGRDTEAKKLLVDDGESYQFIKNITDAGFEAVYIDRAGYEDNGEEVLSFYNSLGIEPIVSSDGMLYVYDIRNIIGN